jgi:hypothetical protein
MWFTTICIPGKLSILMNFVHASMVAYLTMIVKSNARVETSGETRLTTAAANRMTCGRFRSVSSLYRLLHLRLLASTDISQVIGSWECMGVRKRVVRWFCPSEFASLRICVRKAAASRLGMVAVSSWPLPHSETRGYTASSMPPKI